jgi:CheY-like chemotaxis protein
MTVSAGSQGGALFTIRIPSVAGAGVAARPPVATSHHPLTHRPILIAVSSPEAAERIEHLLQHRAYQTQRAPTGLSVLEVVRDRRRAIGAVVLDCDGPGADGDKILRYLRRLVPEIAILLIADEADDVAVGPRTLSTAPSLQEEAFFHALGQLLSGAAE